MMVAVDGEGDLSPVGSPRMAALEASVQSIDDDDDDDDDQAYSVMDVAAPELVQVSKVLLAEFDIDKGSSVTCCKSWDGTGVKDFTEMVWSLCSMLLLAAFGQP